MLKRLVCGAAAHAAAAFDWFLFSDDTLASLCGRLCLI